MEDTMLKRAQEAVNYWNPRTRKIKQWYRLIRLVDELALKTQDKSVETVVSNMPRSFRMLALHLLSTGRVRDRIPITVQDLTERDKLSDCERALHSIWREKDEEQIRAGEMLWRRQFADFAFMTGWYAVFHGVFKDDKAPFFRADILNPIQVFPVWASRELVGCYNVYPAAISEIKHEAKSKDWDLSNVRGIATSGNTTPGKVTVYKCWEMEGDSVIYGVYVNKAAVLAPAEQKGFKTIPITTGPVGGFADRGGLPNDKEYIKRVGESLLEPIRETQYSKNRLRSFLQQITKDIAQSTKYDVTEGGKGAMGPNDRGKIIHLKAEADEKIGQLTPASNAIPELNVLLGQDSIEEQMATIPAVAYGTTMGLELSGYAYNQMITAAYSSLGEINSIMNQVRGMIDKNWLDGFKENWSKGYRMKISGKEVGEHAGFFSKEFGPEDIPDFTYVEVEAPLAVTENLLQRITMARTAIPQGDLMDFTTVADEILQLQDPESVRRRIKEDHMMNSPIMEQAYLAYELKKKAEAERRRNNFDFARFLEYTSERMISQMGYQQGAPTPPSFGVSPEVMPPEMGAVPPAEGRQLYGAAPPRQIGASRFGQGGA